jgi:hypothetical protein
MCCGQLKGVSLFFAVKKPCSVRRWGFEPGKGKCHTEDLGAGSIHGPQQWSTIVASSLNPL